MQYSQQELEKATDLIMVLNNDHDEVFHYEITSDKNTIEYWENDLDAFVYKKADSTYFEDEIERDFFMVHKYLWQFIAKHDLDFKSTFGLKTLEKRLMLDCEFRWFSESDEQESERLEDELVEKQYQDQLWSMVN